MAELIWDCLVDEHEEKVALFPNRSFATRTPPPRELGPNLLALESLPEILTVAGVVSAVRTVTEPSSSRRLKILTGSNLYEPGPEVVKL